MLCNSELYEKIYKVKIILLIIHNLMEITGLQNSPTNTIIHGILVMHKSFCYWLPQY